jgi:hypothetical protein
MQLPTLNRAEVPTLNRATPPRRMNCPQPAASLRSTGTEAPYHMEEIERGPADIGGLTVVDTELEERILEGPSAGTGK